MASIWTVLILVGCFMPGRDVPDIQVPLADKWAHLVLFGGFVFLWLCVVQRPGFRKWVGLFLLGCALGYLVELIQGSGLVSGRSKDMKDVLADSIGGAVGGVLFIIFQKVAKKFAS